VRQRTHRHAESTGTIEFHSKQVPKEVFALLFPGAAEAAEMISFERDEFNNRAPFASRNLSFCESDPAKQPNPRLSDQLPEAQL
jgi:hypothetical protein